MSSVSLNGSNGTKHGGSSSQTFITGKRYYIIDKETRDKLLLIVGEELKNAALLAADEKQNPDFRKQAHKMAQHFIDLEASLLYAEGGIARWENENVGLY